MTLRSAKKTDVQAQKLYPMIKVDALADATRASQRAQKIGSEVSEILGKFNSLCESIARTNSVGASSLQYPASKLEAGLILVREVH